MNTNNRYVIDFWAEGCPPCRKLKPIFEKWAEKHADKADFGMVDVQDEEHAQAVANFNISAVPTVLIVNEEGKELARFVGIPQEKDILAALEAA